MVLLCGIEDAPSLEQKSHELPSTAAVKRFTLPVNAFCSSVLERHCIAESTSHCPIWRLWLRGLQREVWTQSDAGPALGGEVISVPAQCLKA